MRIRGPILGLDEGTPVQDQPPVTSPSLQNMRPFDTDKERSRVGQRPGTILAYSTRIVGDFPVIKMVQIVNTYISPE